MSDSLASKVSADALDGARYRWLKAHWYDAPLIGHTDVSDLDAIIDGQFSEEAIDAPHVHLSSGGRDPDEKAYTKRDVEMLIAIALAAAKQPRETTATPQWTLVDDYLRTHGLSNHDRGVLRQFAGWADTQRASQPQTTRGEQPCNCMGFAAVRVHDDGCPAKKTGDRQ